MRSLALAFMACLVTEVAFAQQADRAPARPLSVTWQAPAPLKRIYEQHLQPPQPEAGERRAASLRPWVREVRRRVPQIAAAEGYFSATVEVEFDGAAREHATVTVTPGPRTSVDAVEIEFAGDLAGEGADREQRRKELRDKWSLKRGAPFRSADWEAAKTRIVDDLTERDYAAGTIGASEAEVDAEAARARLKVVLDSGPRFTLGDVQIFGLERYSEALVRRMVDFHRGQPYRQEDLAELQRRLQTGPWFSTVLVDIPRDAAEPERVPVRVTVTERPTREIGLSLGYGTDDGPRAEAAFRHRDFLDRGYDLQSSVRAGLKRQIGFVDIYMAPGLFPFRGRDVPFRDSVGVLTEHSTIEKLALSRFAVAAYRHFTPEKFETRVGISYQVERSFPEGAEPRITRALAPIIAITVRRVDNLFDPQRGGVLNVQLAAGKQGLLTSQDFVKAYAHYQHWIPITPRDQLLLRTEWGSTFAQSRDGIPEDFLFRAGGSRSNRGYSFQGLGPREGDAVVGGRYLMTASAEYVHWLNEKYGAAAFMDIGDAADTPKEWNSNRSYGVGGRYKTPAGPLALDLAYAEAPRRFRVSFSVTVAF
ncbi:MAG: autotransporter assembly complex protein TamA [Betaproteobacteria bacterium]